MRVLIAEDNGLERVMLRRFVEQLGHEAVVAVDGAQAWELFQADGADVLISDWMMPGLDGPELCRRVRAYPGAPYTYVMLLTVLDDQEHARHGVEVGADDYLRKPLHIDDLEVRLIAAERISRAHRILWQRDAQREQAHEALLRLSSQVAALEDEHQLLTVVASESVALLGAAGGLVSRWDEQRGAVVPVCGMPIEGGGGGGAAQLASARAVERRAPAILSGQPARSSGDVARPAAVAVPLIHADQLLGALALVGSPGQRFSPDDARLLNRLAAMCAAGLAGLDRARRLNSTEQRALHAAARVPSPPTRLIGRDDELERLTAELLNHESRLVTLTGPAGVGKTHLALTAAAQVADRFADGPVFVDLASLDDPLAVMAAIARAVGVGTTDAVKDALEEVRVLLVIDNFEHVLAAANEVGQLLAACPGLKVLITSRAPLRLRFERVFVVTPLALPDVADPLDVAAISRSPSVSLFTERARAVLPSFTLTETNARSVGEVCARLEGLPLAIELAAARSNVLTPQLMPAELEHPLRVLSTTKRDRPSRQRTLRDAIAWSYALLTPEEQRLFRHVAVFSGGFSLEAMAAVVATEQPARTCDQMQLVDAIGGLLDKSVLDRAGSSIEAPRFRMLELFREFAGEQLELCGEQSGAERRHAVFFLSLAERAAPRLRAADQLTWLAQLDLDHRNLQAAVRYAVSSQDGELSLRLVGALAGYWQLRGLVSEGTHWLSRACALGEASVTPTAARARTGAARVAMACRDWSVAADFAEASLRLWRDLGDGYGGAVAEALADLASIRLNQVGRSREARALARESDALARQVGDAWTCAYTAHALGEVNLAHGNHQAARVNYMESLRLATEVGDRVRVAHALEGLAVVTMAERRPDVALRFGGAAAGVREMLRAPLAPPMQALLDARLAPARAALGDGDAARIWNEGRSTTLQSLLAEAGQAGPVDDAGELGSDEAVRLLSRRERDVTALVAHGLRNYEIGERLGITRHTVEVHVSKTLNKLGMASRAQLAVWAVANGLLQPSS